LGLNIPLWLSLKLLKCFYKNLLETIENDLDLLYFIAILQWSIGHPSSASIDGGFWLELVVRQMMFSRIPPKQCASRWFGAST
jgi:hypothetical protein